MQSFGQPLVQLTKVAAEGSERRPVDWKFGLDVLWPLLIGAAIAAAFWRPLLAGAGFVGGDVYNYFMPLKKLYAEGLQAGRIHYWHPKIGNGVSVLGESQTGVFYPFNLLFYSQLDVVSAYNAVFLCHYVLAFVFFYWLSRDRNLPRSASLLAAVVFVYSWFPPKSCLEWSVVTGCWTPLQLLLAYRWLETGRRQWGWLLACVLTLQLSAGHYQLAWVSLVAIGLAALLHPVSWKRKIGLVSFLAVGLLLASPQLLPTLELKGFSMRNQPGFAAEVLYGRIPPLYLLQLIHPWIYSQADEWLKWAGGDSNRIEAHFSLGYIGLFLLGMGLRSFRERWRWWLLLGLGLLLATGTPFTLLKHLPGFGFFRYPGRYSLIAAVFGALLIGHAFDRRLGRRRQVAWWSAIFSVGLGFEFFWSSQAMTYVVMQQPPALSRLGHSEVFRRLQSGDHIFGPDGNTLALGPAACSPPYIGLEPAVYHRLWKDVPNLFRGGVEAEPSLVKKFQTAGVTHFLTEMPLPKSWPVSLLWSGYDPFLHPRWGRNPAEPLWLYRFDASLGSVYLASGKAGVRSTVGVDRIEVELPTIPSPTKLHVCQWRMQAIANFRYWRAMIDGKEAFVDEYDDYLVVKVPPGARSASFEYEPTDFWKGLEITYAVMIICVAFEFICYIRVRRQFARLSLQTS